MITENLNEMIQQDLHSPVGSDKPDYIYTLHRDKLMYRDVKNNASNEEKPATESATNLEVIPESSISEDKNSNYFPETEEALIAYTASIHNKVQTFSIGGYWEIGRTINSFYQGEYGTQELERISKATGIGRDTLNKMCKFARQYLRDQVEVLLSGAFYVSWFQIAQNLSIEPGVMIEVYQKTGDPKQFHNVIMNLKDPMESRGKSKSASIAMPATVKESSTVIDVSAMVIPHEEPGDKTITPIAIDPISDNQVKEANNLRAENETQRKEIESLKHELNNVNQLFQEASMEIETQSDLIDRLNRELKKVYDMVENGANHANILSEIDWKVLG